MSKTDLVVEVIGRSLLWGITLGTFFGFPFLCVFCSPLSLLGPGILFPLLGSIMGGILGALNGIVLSVITLRFTNPLDNTEQYQNAALSASLITTLIAGGAGFFAVMHHVSSNSQIALIATVITLPFTLFAAVYASEKMSSWYIKSLNA